jgi:hypothetical protein
MIGWVKRESGNCGEKKSYDLQAIKQLSPVYYYCGPLPFKTVQHVSVIFKDFLITWESFGTANSNFVVTFIACFLRV